MSYNRVHDPDHNAEIFYYRGGMIVKSKNTCGKVCFIVSFVDGKRKWPLRQCPMCNTLLDAKKHVDWLYMHHMSFALRVYSLEDADE
jgi:hypothetical protein